MHSGVIKTPKHVKSHHAKFLCPWLNHESDGASWVRHKTQLAGASQVGEKLKSMDQQDRDELREGRQKAYKAKKQFRELKEKGYFNKGKYWNKGSQRSDVGKSAAGVTELRSAAQLGDVEKVRRLVMEYSVSVNAVAPDSKGETALHVAVKMANIEVVRFLVQQGGDPNHRDDGGHTPLETAEDCAFLKNESSMKYAGAREQIMLLNGVTIWKVSDSVHDCPRQSAIRLCPGHCYTYPGTHTTHHPPPITHRRLPCTRRPAERVCSSKSSS
jgi:hypothetical protein